MFGERRRDAQPQRHGRTCHNETFELGGQNSQAIEARHSEGLTACGDWTGVPRRNRRCRVGVDVGVDNDLAVLDHDQPRTSGARLGPEHARIDQASQPDRSAPRQRPA